MSGISNYLTGGTDMSQEVYEANRPYYSSIYSSLDRAKQIAANQVKQSYGEQIGNTYLQGQQASANINSSALGANYKQYLQNQLQQNITRAYDTYLNQQQQDITEATAAYDTAMQNLTSGITEAGQTLGDYRDRYASGAIEYGANLVKSGAFKLKDYADYNAYTTAEQGKVGKENLLSEEEFQRQKRQQEIDWLKFEGLYDAEGNVNWDAVKTALYAQRNEAGEILTDDYGNALMDGSGELSTQGQDIFDYLMKYDQKGFENYQGWLSKNDKDLYQWSIQRSILNDPTNAYTAMKTLGADGVYSFVERFGGLTEKQTEKIFSNFDIAVEEVTRENFDSKGKENIESFQKGIDAMSQLYNDLGLNSYLPKDEKGKTFLDKLAKAKDKNSILDSLKDMKAEIDTLSGIQVTDIALGSVISLGALIAAPFTGGASLQYLTIGGALIGVGISSWMDKENKKDEGRDWMNRYKETLKSDFDAFALQSATIAKELRKQTINK